MNSIVLHLGQMNSISFGFLCNEKPQLVRGSKKLTAMSSQNKTSLLELSWLDKKTRKEGVQYEGQ